jgi:hypothetical protein
LSKIDEKDATDLANAAKVLGLEMERRQRALANARGETATVHAAADLALLFQENMPMIIFALKVYGGLKPSPPKRDPMPGLPELPDFLSPPMNGRVMGASGAAVAAATK